MHYLLTLLLGPILLVQGYLVKKSTPRLPEPPGDRKGISGKGQILRLLILGDSAGAGVGAEHQEEALSGQVIGHLAKHFEIHWQLHAVTGATTHSTLNDLSTLGNQNFDVVLLSLGVNDVTSGMRLSRWLEQQNRLREILQHDYHSQHIISSGMPPIHGFPALKQPLRWYLGRRANEFDQALQRQISTRPNCHYLNLRFSEDKELMATDGFHPGPEVYKEWGKLAADLIIGVIRQR